MTADSDTDADSPIVRVGSRASRLAMAQTEEVVRALRSLWRDRRFEIVQVVPDGDRRKAAPLLSLGRGTFVKGVEERLLAGDVDIAVHSAKDMPSALPDGLSIAAFPKRGDARDALVNRWGATLDEMPSGARVGTSSPRRAGQILAARPDIRIVPMRGNVDTRLERVANGDYDAAALAAAGLERLGRLDEASHILPPEICVPDAGQGALAVETRAEDRDMIRLAAPLNHAPTWASVTAERAFVETLGGGCRVPVAAHAVPCGDGELSIIAMACLPDGSRVFRAEIRASASAPRDAGREAANALLQTGADGILGDGG